MAITSSQLDSNGVERNSAGSHLDDAATPAALEVTLGYKPRYVQLVNQTDRISFEWYNGMTDAHAIKTVAAGTRTAETSGGITVTDTGFSIDAAAIIQNKQYRWVAR